MRKNWTPNQIDAVVTAAKAANTDLFNAMRTAMRSLLPVEQWMADGTLKNPNNWTRPLFTRAVEVGLISRTHVRWRRIADEEPVEVAPVVEFCASEPVTLATATMGQLMEELGKRIQSELEARMLAHVNDVVAAGLAHSIGSAPVAGQQVQQSERRSCFRALAVGLLPAQEHILAAKLADKPVELRAWKNGPLDSLRASARWADKVYLATKFVSHETQNLLRKEHAAISYVNGSVTDMITSIELDCGVPRVA